jgi:hypothetical protein
MDEAVQPQLIELIDSTLQHPEDDDTIHGFAL